MANGTVPRRLEDGRLVVPVRATGPGGAIGDGIDTIGPDHPEYAKWDEWLRWLEQEREWDRQQRESG